VQFMVWRGFVIGSRFKGCFHNFYEHWVSHNIEGNVCLIKQSCPVLVQILFFGWMQSFKQWNLRRVGMLLFVDLLEPYVLFIGGVKFQAPSTWNVKTYFPSTKGFNVSMATSFVHSFEIWVGTSKLFSGGGASPPHQANNAFTHGCVFEHTTILAHLLPSYWCPNGRAFYPCDIKWHYYKTCIPSSPTYPLTSNTMDSTRSTFPPSIKQCTQEQ
jgi:hypothetical protein